MPKPRDVSGQRFGRLVAIERAPYNPGHSKGKAYWLCSCDCGGEHTVQVAKLTTGATVSCGCWRRELQKTLNARITRHLKTPTIRTAEDRELRRLQGEAKRLQTFKTERYRELRRSLAKSYWSDPNRSGQARENLRSRMAARSVDKDFKDKAIKSSREYWDDETRSGKHREKLSSILKLRWGDSEYISKMMASLDRRWSDEEYRNKHAERMYSFFDEIRSLPHFIENQKIALRRMFPKKCVLAAGLPLLKDYVDRARVLLDEGECMEVAIDALRQEFVVKETKERWGFSGGLLLSLSGCSLAQATETNVWSRRRPTGEKATCR
jgi:hypothetical protein